ncbi:MAG: putative stage sporulation protein [Polyangiaceae bacterium]|jgi:hypothetical protein|nr:putative stage sporulation protein [Polyangiaceae bacterium]
MRWFVEVSRVGDSTADEKYCVEAKQWQAALQEARKLRGDSGPLSKFSIELLDDGYRAVDPKQKLRFVVAKAPLDAELTTEAPAHRNGQVPTSLVPSASLPPVTPSAAPPGVVSSVAAATMAPASVLPAPAHSAFPAARPVSVAASATPSPAVPPVVAPAAPSVPVPPQPSTGLPVSHADAYAGVPSSNLSPNAPAGPVQVATPPGGVAAPSALPPRVTSAPRAVSARAPAGISIPADVIPPAPALPQNLGPSVAKQNLTQPSAAMDMPPPSSVLRKRQEEPTTESPITYREVAYVVPPGVTRGSVEALLWAAFRDISRELAGRTDQKFVQLAVFDHSFDKRPERPPLGTLAWKDWRGNPVLTFPFFDGTQPARASVPAPSIKPVPVVSISSSAPPAALAPSPRTAAAAVPETPPAPPPPVVIPVAEPTPIAAPAPVVIAPTPAAVVAPIASIEPAVVPIAEVVAPAPSVVAPAPSVAQAAPPVVEATPPVVEATPPVVEATPPVAEPAPLVVASAPPTAAPEPSAPIPLTREKMSSSHPSAGRSSRPRMAAVRRRAGEDLIAELFETMHDLHFMQGVADGAEFMLAALDSVLPCDGVLIHVFDINHREFVVTRAKGPGAMQALLHRTPDSEPFFTAVMRRPGSVVVNDVAQDPRLLGPRWDALGIKPARALCGPVRQGGRYLGLVEAVNPLGDAPFHQTEQNAVDYICEQFAQFLVNRPIVLDADVILRR